MKRNGFSRPFHAKQIAAWIAITINVVIYYALFVPLSPNPTYAIAISLAYFAILIALVTLAYKSTEADPADTVVLEELAAKANQQCYNNTSIE